MFSQWTKIALVNRYRKQMLLVPQSKIVPSRAADANAPEVSISTKTVKIQVHVCRKYAQKLHVKYNNGEDIKYEVNNRRN